MISNRWIILTILSLFLFAFYLNSTTFFRLKLADHYIQIQNYDKTIYTYRNILRVQHLKSNNILNDLEKQINTFVLKTVENYFKEAINFYCERKFKAALGAYNAAINISKQMYPYLNKNTFEMANIDYDEIQTIEKDVVFKLLMIAQRAKDFENNNLKGINLLENSFFLDKNKDNIPDGFIFFTQDSNPYNKATSPNKEITLVSENEGNIYHVWQENGRGYFATYFNIGRVPANTFFTFSIDKRIVNAKGEVQPMLYTTRLSNQAWGSGNNYSEVGLVKDLGNSWKREFHTIRTNEYSDIVLSGWIVAWDYGQAEGDIYVRKPKLEIGNKPTSWNNIF